MKYLADPPPAPPFSRRGETLVNNEDIGINKKNIIYAIR
jgi:hypothetical protein